MSRKFVSLIALTVVFVGSLFATFKVQRVAASETIYIYSDGSIHGTNKIVSSDNATYIFTDNIKGSIVVYRSNIIINGNGFTLQGDGYFETSQTGIQVGTYDSHIGNVTILNMQVKGFLDGIRLYNSFRSKSNRISGNTITENGFGIRLWLCENDSISGNNIVNNYVDGIKIYTPECIGYENSYGISISGNIITGNKGCGIECEYIIYSSISRNTIMSNRIGIGWTSFNNIIANNIEDNGIGLIVNYPSSNRIYHNNFNNNTQHVVYDWGWESTPNPNTWDDGYPSGGNYWSNYTGVDANHDGIGDSPYIVIEDYPGEPPANIDHYPLMNPYPIPEFPSFLILPLFMIAALLAVTVYKRKHVLTVNRG
jgi:parallel beta-helix repeat protein